LRRDSGGAGKFRGGLAVDLHVRNFSEGRWNLGRRDRRGLAPWGLAGGKGGAIGDYLLKKPGDNEFKLTVGHNYPTPANSEVKVRQMGGGGWGDPLERDPEAVRADVLDDYVSVEAAKRDYGVVLTGDRAVDKAATEALRREMKAAANGNGAGLAEEKGGTLLTDLTKFATGVTT
jgi:N-methylhydantoinase B